MSSLAWSLASDGTCTGSLWSVGGAVEVAELAESVGRHHRVRGMAELSGPPLFSPAPPAWS